MSAGTRVVTPGANRCVQASRGSLPTLVPVREAAIADGSSTNFRLQSHYRAG